MIESKFSNFYDVTSIKYPIQVSFILMKYPDKFEECQKIVSSLTFAQSTTEKALLQPITYGIKGGLNISHLGLFENAKAGFNVGTFANIPLGNSISLQPEILYSQYGAFVERDLTMKYDNSPRTKLGYITIPVMLQYHINPKFYFEAGPEFGFLVSSKYKVLDTADSPASSKHLSGINKFNLGLGMGLGYDFTKNFGLNVRYISGITHISKNNLNTNTVMQLGFTYKFK